MRAGLTLHRAHGAVNTLIIGCTLGGGGVATPPTHPPILGGGKFKKFHCLRQGTSKRVLGAP